jgi:hypothetical protein
MRKGWVRELGGGGWVIWMGESSLPFTVSFPHFSSFCTSHSTLLSLLHIN